MNQSAIRQMIWKESYESLPSLILGIFMQAGFTAVALHSRLIPDVAVMIFCIIMSWIFAAIWGMSPVGGERQNGSFGFLMTLPIRPWKVLLSKLVVAMIGVAIPLTASWFLFVVMAGERELVRPFMQYGFLGGMVGSTSMTCWVICVGIRQPTEARVAMTGLGVLFVMWLLLVAISALNLITSQIGLLLTALTPIGPFAGLQSYTMNQSTSYWYTSLFLNALVMALLFFYASLRFAKPCKTRG